MGLGQRTYVDSSFTNHLRDLDSYKKVKSEPVIPCSNSSISSDSKPISQNPHITQGNTLLVTYFLDMAII